jgi:hydroxyacylglutathione hydrolase
LYEKEIVSSLKIRMFPRLADNYGYLVHDDVAGVTATIDTPDADAILAVLDENGWALTHILNTHHHADHAGGNLVLKRQTGCTIIGPRADSARIRHRCRSR